MALNGRIIGVSVVSLFVITAIVLIYIYVIQPSLKSGGGDTDTGKTGTPGDDCTPDAPEPHTFYEFNSDGYCGDVKGCDEDNFYFKTPDDTCVKDNDTCTPPSSSKADPNVIYGWKNGACTEPKGCHEGSVWQENLKICATKGASCSISNVNTKKTKKVENGKYIWDKLPGQASDDDTLYCAWNKKCDKNYIPVTSTYECAKANSTCSDTQIKKLVKNAVSGGVYSLNSSGKCVLTGCGHSKLLAKNGTKCVSVGDDCRKDEILKGKKELDGWGIKYEYVIDPYNKDNAVCESKCIGGYVESSKLKQCLKTISIEKSFGGNINQVKSLAPDGSSVSDGTMNYSKRLAVGGTTHINVPKGGIIQVWGEAARSGYSHAWANVDDYKKNKNGIPTGTLNIGTKCIHGSCGSARFGSSAFDDDDWHYDLSLASKK